MRFGWAWSDAEDFNLEGNYIRQREARAKPKPYSSSRPIVMNAGASPAGQAFAIRNCDALFSMTPKGKLDEFTAHIGNVKAQRSGRQIDVYTVAVVTCRRTQSEAEQYYRHWAIDNADWSAVDRIMAMRGVTRERFPDDFEERRYHQANGMGGVPITGDPDTVARRLIQLAATGAKGIAQSFVNYLDDLPFFPRRVLPRLTALGMAAR